MKFIIFFTIIITLFSFAKWINTNSSGYKPTFESEQRERLSNIIIAKVATSLQLKHGLIPCGSGGCISNGINMLAVHFDYRLPTEIENGRKLLISAVQEFVAIVNNEPRIQPYINAPPFNEKNVDISIFLQNPDGSNLTSGLQVISAKRGILQYEIDNPDGPLLKTLLEETYEEALEKLNLQTNSQNLEPVFEDAI